MTAPESAGAMSADGAAVSPWSPYPVLHEWALGRRGQWRYVVVQEEHEVVVWMTQANGIWKCESGLWANEIGKLARHLTERDRQLAEARAELAKTEYEARWQAGQHMQETVAAAGVAVARDAWRRKEVDTAQAALAEADRAVALLRTVRDEVFLRGERTDEETLDVVCPLLINDDVDDLLTYLTGRASNAKGGG